MNCDHQLNFIELGGKSCVREAVWTIIVVCEGGVCATNLCNILTYYCQLMSLKKYILRVVRRYKMCYLILMGGSIETLGRKCRPAIPGMECPL